MNKLVKKLCCVLTAFLFIPVLSVGVNAETAAEPKTLSMPVEIRDNSGCNYVDYSTFDGVHVATLENNTVNDGEVTINLKPTVTDWSAAKYAYVRIESVNYTATLMAVKAADVGGNFFFLNNTAYVTTLGAESTGTDGGQSVLNSGFSGFAKFDLSKQQKVVGESDSLNLSNVVVLQFSFYYGQKNKLNLGDIYIEKEDGTTAKVFDAKNLTLGNDAGQYAVEYNGYGTFDESACAAATRVSVMKANELKSYANNENQWQAFFTCIPGDISEYNGISYYIDNTLSSGELFFNKCIRENPKNGIMEHWFVDGTTPYAMVYPDNGEAYVGNANVIPAGFKGTIVVPFSDLTLREVAGIVEDRIFDPSNLFTRIEFAMDTANGTYSSRDFIIKDLKLVSDARQFKDTVQVPSTVGDVKIVNPFEYYDDFDLMSDWNIQWTLSAEAEISLIDNPAEDVVGVSNKAMKIVCGAKTTVADANQDTCIQWSMNPDQGDAKNAKGITYWIKNTSYAQIGFRVEFDSMVKVDGVETSQRWQSLSNCRYMLINTATGEETMCMGKGGVYIPKGFEGYVRIDFSQFARPNWVTVGGDLSTENRIGTAYIIMNSTYHQGDSFLFDSFGYYYTDVELTTTFNTPANSFTNAMKSDFFAE